MLKIFKGNKMEQEEDLLTRLRIAIFGNGDKKVSLVERVGKLEEDFRKTSTKLTIVIVLLLILITVQAPALMAGIRGF